MVLSKDADVKYPHSANLFQFCRLVLDKKFGGARVIDQDVGQILGFDPADCSHWKKGKKNIRSIESIKAIAQHLGVDDKLVADIAVGEMDDVEGYLEVGGYGPFAIENRLIDEAKKEFYRSSSNLAWQNGKDQDYLKTFVPDVDKIDFMVQTLQQRINFKEAPLYFPEIAAHISYIKLISDNNLRFSVGAPLVEAAEHQGELRIRYAAGFEMRPYVRYLIAKKIGHFYLTSTNSDLLAKSMGGGSGSAIEKYAGHEPLTTSLAEKSPERNLPGAFAGLKNILLDAEENIFAAKLLAPANLIRKELQTINLNKDIVTQLSELFWVSKQFMNVRIKDILERNAKI